MEEQEASVTKADCVDMPDGLEPVSPSEKTEREIVTTGGDADVVNRNDDNALQECNDTAPQECNDTASQECNDTAPQECNDTAPQEYNDTAPQEYNDTAPQECNDTALQECNDTNIIKVITDIDDAQDNKEKSNDLDSTERGEDSRTENLQTDTDSTKEMESLESGSIIEEKRLKENNVDCFPANDNDDIGLSSMNDNDDISLPSGSVEITSNVEADNKSMDLIEDKSALEDNVTTDLKMKSDEEPKDDSISELKDQSDGALTSINNDDEDNLSIKVSDSISKDDISKEISLSEKSDKRNEDSEAMDVDPVEDTTVRQNGPEECHDERTSTNGDTSHSKSDMTIANEEKMEVDEKCSADQDKDNRDNPEFESAPETAEMSHNDSQVLDPFDELLKDESSKPEVRSSRLSRRTLNTTSEDDHNDTTIDDDINDSTVLDDDHTDVPDDSLVDDVNVADVTEGQGADEEICLLPDTEREISEADKLKALAAKKPKEVESTTVESAFDALVADSENKDDDESDSTKLRQPKGELSTDENGENVENELNSLHEDIDLGEDDGMREAMDVENEKEKETEEVIEPPLENLTDNIIQEIPETEETCLQCSESKKCTYRLVIEHETKHLCTKDCIKAFQDGQSTKYTVTLRKRFIKEVGPTEIACIHCTNVKDCFYKISDEVDKFICGENCLKEFVGEDKERHIISRKKKIVQEIMEKEGVCYVCSETKKCTYEVPIEGELKNLCTAVCVSVLQSMLPSIFRIKKRKIIKVKQTPLLKLKVISNATDKYLDSGHKMVAKTPEQVAAARADRDRSFFRQCAQCQAPYLGNDKNLSWETMDFCNESCLGKYQNIHGSHCANCKNDVSITSLGKYCVRFGYDIRQFCCSGCLEEFKKGLKICCYCQRDISVGYEGFLAPVGDKGQFKDFCSQFCVEKFDQMSKNPEPPPVWARCAVCSKEKPTQLEVAIDNKNSLRLCSEPCFAAFKFVNHIFPDQCRWCNKYFERKSSESYTIYTESASHCFCTKACMNVYISNSRHIVPCNWCKVKKYNFDMIKRTLDNGQTMMMCSLNCLTLYQVSVTAVSSRRIKCDQCKRTSQAQYHLTMSDATVRNFCTYQCVMSFQGQYSKTPLMVEGDAVNKQAVPTGAPRRTLNSQRNNAKTQGMKIIEQRSGGMPVIASVQSLAAAPTPSPQVTLPSPVTRGKGKRNKQLQQPQVQERVPTPPPVVPPKPPTPPPPPPPKIYNHVIIKPAPPKEVKNMSTLTKPLMVTKGITCKPNMVSKEVQTEDHLQRRILIPIPVPIYVPSPMAMYSIPFPIPVPIPLPIPIPVFIPTTRNTATGIMKEIKKIHEKMPTDPFEAELLMMAEMVAGEKKKAESDSESEEEAPAADDGFSPDTMDTGNSAFGEDVLQMALKMATEYEEPAVDLESAMTASTITPSSHPNMPTTLDDNSPLHHHQLMLLEQQRAAAAVAGRKRGARALPPPSPVPAPPPTRAKRARRHEPAPPPQPAHSEPPREPQEKPDANMCLKYTFGVNAWKQWVVTKNQEMEKSTVRRKPFKSEILQLTADELNYSLCLFVKEVRKPNGSEYAPDTIYYLVLGIQQYLFENGRIDNIFTDSYYEKFTECLDEVARKFSVLYNDSQYIVTRVEEEHLWESKQLGAHSPHVLLSTLMFFNTKHFNLVTAEEHMQLSFSHIMKHWKRNPNQPGAAKIPGSRNVLLRFYPPQSALEANSRKKKVYEQQENEENPLRCPVKLYEFYLSKCPESVKTRNDVFYLMPERSCVPDSPVWYSTQALGKEPLSKMLHRVKMVKEINIALLTS